MSVSLLLDRITLTDRVFSHIIYAHSHKRSPCDGIIDATRAIIDCDIICTFTRCCIPSSNNHQVYNQIDRYQIRHAGFLAQNGSEQSFADCRNDTGRTVEIIYPTADRFLEAGQY